MKKRNVAFLHPDLGLGGAERLIVDAALELVSAGHAVDIYTTYHDPQRCFEETRGSGGFGVTVAGDWFPRHIAGRFLALCAYIRCILAALYMAWLSFKGKAQYDAVIVDQVSVVIPFLKHLTRSRVLFYCHFPDMLLAQRRSQLKKLYRIPLDWVEQTTTGHADLVLVNSAFTQGVFKKTFSRLAERGIVPDVLHPAVPIPSDGELQEADATWEAKLDRDLVSFMGGGPMLLSINRFERKKGISLAVQALHEFLIRAPGSLPKVTLVLAGGFDARLPENVQHLQELKDLVRELDLHDRVRFVVSFTDSQRAALLAACTAVVYTPQFEHFGIVPLEAMAAKKPVIAVNNGGPVETVAHEETGYLCEPTPAAFASAFRQLLCVSEDGGTSDARQMGEAAKARVQAQFSRAAFGCKLQAHLEAAMKDGGKIRRT
ncbi:hypothetical protein DUNSADRAFT_1348 [Dunaliella salina]|uniref:Alpha-1,3/1,6-mannosyltransferase ALG2 n=1 Tax=Dunaliella salina TaxID=3046 RepID=A0ABQ7GX73_DUNSA|nr:hypothetical protein DUNSADRAFT_1348 [Dunaliella salina]|eukprot:KAF5839212.1 hypothetical protein DUNSADRAFT_1348 [Dunaliella salina]